MTNETTDAKEMAEKNMGAACDLIIERAMAMMVDEIGAPHIVMLDRMTTWIAAQSCSNYGKNHTAEQFRQFAARIEDGLFDGVTGENKPRH